MNPSRTGWTHLEPISAFSVGSESGFRDAGRVSILHVWNSTHIRVETNMKRCGSFLFLSGHDEAASWTVVRSGSSSWCFPSFVWVLFSSPDCEQDSKPYLNPAPNWPGSGPGSDLDSGLDPRFPPLGLVDPEPNVNPVSRPGLTQWSVMFTCTDSFCFFSRFRFRSSSSSSVLTRSVPSWTHTWSLWL